MCMCVSVCVQTEVIMKVSLCRSSDTWLCKFDRQETHYRVCMYVCLSVCCECVCVCVCVELSVRPSVSLSVCVC